MRRRSSAAAATLVAFAGCGGEQVSMAFDRPVAVAHDAEADRYLVCNAGGYIARVAPDGSGERDWIRGGSLRAPRGIALTEDLLYVTDGRALRSYDRRTGEVRDGVLIGAATRLDAVSVAPDGVAYVTDPGLDEQGRATGTDAIWRVDRSGGVTTLAAGAELGHPSGIVALAQAVYVVNRRDGAFYSIDYDGRRIDLGRAPQPGLAGLARAELPVGGEAGAPTRPVWFATSEQGCVYRFDLVGGNAALPVRLAGPGAPCVDAGRARLLVPLVGENRLHALPL